MTAVILYLSLPADTDNMEIQLKAVCQHCGSLTSGEKYCCPGCETIHLSFQNGQDQAVLRSAWIYLDQPSFRELYFHAQDEYQYYLYVEGMHCSSCVHLLEKLPEYDDTITEARVDFSRSRLALKVKPDFSLARTAARLEDWGYRPHFVGTNDSSEKAAIAERRQDLKRIAVAGACASNIMLFVIPIYAGLVGEGAQIFNWVGFVLFLPVLLYSAQSFYRGAWNSLRYHILNVDLPVTIALWSGFILSTVNLWRGEGAVYFDSTASFLFLILSARFLLKKVQGKYLLPLKMSDLLQSPQVLAQFGKDWQTIPSESIEVGMTLKLRAGQGVPADGILQSPEALLDMSLLSGESFPLAFSQGMEVSAGCKVLSPEMELRVTQDPRHSRLAKMLQNLEASSLKKTQFVVLTDKLAQGLIAVVFFSALAYFALTFQTNFQEAFNRALALLVLACPCALAFGTPLTFGLALKKAQQKGILIKDGTSLERVLKIKNIFFDKTGTLTTAELKLVQTEPAQIDPAIQAILLGLEKSSSHPIAFALRREWTGVPLREVSNAHEILGRGVQGEIDSDIYQIHTLNESVHEASLALVLLKNGEVLCRLYFEDPLREDARSAIQTLQRQGFNCFLLSGDRRERVQHVAALSGVPADQSYAELYPEDKKDLISQYPSSCMIGDGANDALSLQAADVGIAVKGSVALNLQAADIYFLREGLTPLLDLLRLARTARHVLVRNLSLSLVYNLAGGILALSGFVSPLLAAILMPISSGLIILSTLWGFR